ncbi:MAG: NUDIX hydrolase [Chloroflexi bacterium]|nr:NUDIX hydrolase [Chloroflexota bacterium]
MEQKRIEVSRQNKIDPGYSRLQSIAIVIIRGVDRSKSYFLHQWDSHAEQYQLIGGRQRPGESIVETAKRELQEELGQQDWVYGRDYDLTQLTDQPVAMLALSRTYGALTRYEHWPFHARLMVDSLHLSEIDKWIESDEMRRGVTKTGKRVSSPEQYRLLDAVIPSGLEALHESIKIKQTANWWEYIEIKPNILGLVSVDLKGLAQEWLRKFRGKP